MLPLADRQTLRDLGCARVHKPVTITNAKVEGPTFWRTDATNGVGAHDAPAVQRTISVEYALIEPEVRGTEIASENAQVQRGALRVNARDGTRHSHKVKSTIGDSRLLPQLVPLCLARACFRQLGHELDPAGSLVLGQSTPNEVLQLAREFCRAAIALSAHDVRRRFDQLVLVGATDNADLEHRSVLDQCVFD